jgi:transposase
MDVLYPCVCGLDIHKAFLLACVIRSAPQGQVTKTVRRFSTMADDLQALAAWLHEQGVTQVAMESTGVYWKPIYNLLEGDFTLLLANAQHIKAVPGRKTDVRDCEWIADLLRHGLLRGSFVPDKAHRELRELTRYRTALIHERSREVNRLQKTLEGANIKLGVVATNIVGATGQAILHALVAGETDAATLAELAKGRLREKLPLLARALAGQVGAHQRFLLAQQLAHLDALDAQLAELDAEVAARTRPFADALERLDTIPGVARRTAEVLVAELGTDMTRFPSAQHLASWAGMCPGNDESAGKRRSGKTRKGNPWVRSALIEAAHGAGRKKDTYLQAQYRRLVARKGGKQAAVAVGHSILVIVYHLLRGSAVYEDLGVHDVAHRDQEARKRRAVKALEGMGYDVNLIARAQAA